MSHAGHGHGHAAMLHAVMQVSSALFAASTTVHMHGLVVRVVSGKQVQIPRHGSLTRTAPGQPELLRRMFERLLKLCCQLLGARTLAHLTSEKRSTPPPAPHTSRAKRECGTWCARDGCLCAPPERHGRSPAHCTASVSQRSDEKSVLEQSWMREKPNCSARDENSGIVRLSLSPNGS